MTNEQREPQATGQARLTGLMGGHPPIISVIR